MTNPEPRSGQRFFIYNDLQPEVGQLTKVQRFRDEIAKDIHAYLPHDCQVVSGARHNPREALRQAHNLRVVGSSFTPQPR